MKLNDLACKGAKPADKPYKKFDGGGLYLAIQPSGSKLWRLKYRYLGKEKLLSIGAYPIISLADAREARNEAKKLLSQNPPIDPMERKATNKRTAIRESENSFEAVALEWFENNKEKWSEKYAQKIIRILEMNVFPHIGSRPISQIKPPDLLDVLRKMEDRKAYEIASKAKQISGMVFKYGIQTGKCEWNAADNLSGALKPRKTKHFAAMDVSHLPDFIKAIKSNDARLFEFTRRAIWFSLYTFQRPGEIRQAQWSEIDWDAKEWHISADKMKMRRAHIVPLSNQVLEVLEAQKKEIEHLNTDWVFPSLSKPINPMSDGTVNKAIKRLGFGDIAVAHGFRALARTAIREKLKYDSEIIEKQLAHKTKNPLGEAYDRTQFLEERKTMMQDWADYLDTVASQGKVIFGDFGKSA